MKRQGGKYMQNPALVTDTTIKFGVMRTETA
jgi:hypothetical protein